MRAGQTIASRGTVITPAVAAEIAAGGHARVSVLARPTVAFIPTGNELVPYGEPLPMGKNYETNSLMIKGKIEAWGGRALVFGIVADNAELIVQTVRAACAQADIVVLNAGSSKGSDDWNIEVLDEIGTVLYHQTNHGPGHHSSGAMVEGVPVVGISGPPRGAGFTTDFYLRPLMQRYLGLPIEPPRVRVRLTAPFPAGGPGGPKPHDAKLAGEDKPLEASDGSTFFGIKMLSVAQGEDGMLEGTPCPGMPGGPDSEAANAYYALPSGMHDVRPRAGDAVDVEMRP